MTGTREGPQAGLALSSKDQHHFDPVGTGRKPCVISVVRSLVKERNQCSERVLKSIFAVAIGIIKLLSYCRKVFYALPGSKVPLFLTLLYIVFVF